VGSLTPKEVFTQVNSSFGLQFEVKVDRSHFRQVVITTVPTPNCYSPKLGSLIVTFCDFCQIFEKVPNPEMPPNCYDFSFFATISEFSGRHCIKQISLFIFANTLQNRFHDMTLTCHNRGNHGIPCHMECDSEHCSHLDPNIPWYTRWEMISPHKQILRLSINFVLFQQNVKVPLGA